MRLPYRIAILGVFVVTILAPLRASAASIVLNGGFEAGLTSWTVADQPGGSGSWFSQTGVLSPVNGFAVPAPPEGLLAAMTDQGGPGSHVLYQDFVVPATVSAASFSFQAFIQNFNGAFVTPATLDYAAGPNQQARVDIITTTADPFSVAGGDVLLNLFQTLVGDPATSGYSVVSSDLTAFLQAHLGQTLRLRFAEADNQFFFNFGVDDVVLDVTAVPEPATMLLFGLGAVAARRSVRRRAQLTTSN
jgi:hypothetical protein